MVPNNKRFLSRAKISKIFEDNKEDLLGQFLKSHQAQSPSKRGVASSLAKIGVSLGLEMGNYI